MTPRRAFLIFVLVLSGLCLAFAPVLFPGVRALDMAARICVFVALAASYDLLIGYAGIVSFAHAMFFGMGAYGVGLAAAHLGRGPVPLIFGAAAGTALAVLVAALIGAVSLRVRAIFFAMITLAVASVAAVLVSQLSGLTGGEDGLTFQIPRALGPAAQYGSLPAVNLAVLDEIAKGHAPLSVLFGRITVTGHVLCYYLVFAGMVVLVGLLLRLTVSPFGRVLVAIRENPARAEAIGYSVVRYRILANCLAAAAAALAGALYALWLRYVGPGTVLGFGVMVDVLLMVVIGGMGTIWGPALGAVLITLAQGYLQGLLGAGQGVFEGLPVLARLFAPERWLLWLGVIFILSVYFFPSGLAGRRR